MPNVSGKKFPYTKAGKKAAADYAKKIRPGVPKIAKKIKPVRKAAMKPRPTGNSAVAPRSMGRNETLYNMDFGKVYGDASKSGMRRRPPMPGVTRRRINYSGRVST